MTIRPTVPADIPHCIAEPLPYRIKAVTALAGDEVLGLGGLCWRPDGSVVCFAQILPAGRRYPFAIHRAGLAVMALIRASRVPLVLAEAQPDNPAAGPWLERLGFERAEFGGNVAYLWRR